jgi:glycerophosphoryl diester phosphodiesterase
MLKIGHRGARGYAAENTLTSFKKAIELGVDGIELDVYLSSDNEIVVIHDETIDRITSGKGFVKNFTSETLKQYGIPTLIEVLDLVNNNIIVNIELKSYNTFEKVVALIEKYVIEKNWDYNNFLVSSFDWDALQQVRFLSDKIPIGVLTESNLELAFSFSKFIKAIAIHPYFDLLNEENTKKMQEKGFLILPWTVNELEDIQKMKSLHVDGIISDFPDRL